MDLKVESEETDPSWCALHWSQFLEGSLGAKCQEVVTAPRQPLKPIPAFPLDHAGHSVMLHHHLVISASLQLRRWERNGERVTHHPTPTQPPGPS